MKIRKTICTLLITIAAMLLPMSASASPKSKAIDAYNDFLSQKTITVKNSVDGSKNTIHMNKCKFGIGYIDKDNVPELFVQADYKELPATAHQAAVLIYTFRNGKVKYIGMGNEDGTTYYPGRGIVCTTSSMEGSCTEYFSMSAQKVQMTQVLHSSSSWDWTKGELSTEKYYSANRQISKSEFDNTLAKYTGKTKEKKLNVFANTAKNRKTRMK